MLTLQRPDPKVSALMHENKGIKEGDAVRPSIFAIPFKLGGRKVVLNTFTSHCIETSRFSLFEDPGSFMFDGSDPEIEDLIAADFLVRQDFDETKQYTEVISLLRRIESTGEKGYTGYTILPTTSCNARCEYCYEQGVKYETMSNEIVEQTIRYIHATRRENATIHFRWFGGEPLIGERIIDDICEAMRKTGVKYSSTMVSNGSMMTEEIAKKAKDDWNLTNIQITIDGREKAYCEVKRYRAFEGSPYKAVLKGIHSLLACGIRVSIRLNVDENNLEEMFALVDELEEEFKDDSMISIYCHSIYAESEDDQSKDHDALYDGIDRLSERLEQFNVNRRVNSKKPDDITRGYYDRCGSLKRSFCMADSPMAGPVILPNGMLKLCEHISDVPESGSVYDETTVDRGTFVKWTRYESEKCRKCGMLPICTDFTSCPIMVRDCFRDTMAKEKDKLRFLETERRLPPVSMEIKGRVIRVTEPVPEFIEENRDRLVPSYLKFDETIDCAKAKKLTEQERE